MIVDGFWPLTHSWLRGTGRERRARLAAVAAAAAHVRTGLYKNMIGGR